MLANGYDNRRSIVSISIRFSRFNRIWEILYHFLSLFLCCQRLWKWWHVVFDQLFILNHGMIVIARPLALIFVAELDTIVVWSKPSFGLTIIDLGSCDLWGPALWDLFVHILVFRGLECRNSGTPTIANIIWIFLWSTVAVEDWTRASFSSMNVSTSCTGTDYRKVRVVQYAHPSRQPGDETSGDMVLRPQSSLFEDR